MLSTLAEKVIADIRLSHPTRAIELRDGGSDEARADAYLYKPFEIDDLLAVVGRHARNRPS